VLPIGNSRKSYFVRENEHSSEHNASSLFKFENYKGSNMSARFEPKLPKRWDPKLEEELIKIWQEERLYEFKYEEGKPIFSIDTPPPYASGRWHVGGAIHYSQIDMIARYMRLRGYNVYFPMGIDRNGLPIEVQVEKEFGLRIWEVDREYFINKCKELLDKYEKQILYICRRMGFSMFNLDNPYRTDSPEYRALTQATFIKLWKEGLIYEDYRPNNYCPRCRTTIADAEVEYKEEETELVYIKFKVKETGEELIIATTRPELLGACAAVTVHPDDDRYKHLHGKHAIVPIYEREVPIIPHKETLMEFGTGVMMLCSYGDTRDVRLFRELKLKPIILINEEGKLTENAGKYAGLTVKEARRRIVEDLKKMGLIEKIEKIKHRVPICWRCKTPIEIIPMKEFYLKQVDFLNAIRNIADKMKFHPSHAKQLLLNWVNSVTTDWPISRRRWYGTEIPIWYCKKCGTPHLPPPGRYYRPWKDKPPFEKCVKCGHTEFVGEERTLDTWMDSSISPLFISGWMRDKELFKVIGIPVSLRPQGKEIVRTWLYYTLLRVYMLTKKPAFEHVWISGLVMDAQGRKMSKSLGNVVYPEGIIEKYGADALRLAGATAAMLLEDIRFDERRVAACAKFIQKLWSIARFISMFPEPEKKPELMPSDKWIIAETYSLIKRVTEYFDDFEFFATNELMNFVWFFADHYIEMAKDRAYGAGFNEEEQKAAWWTLHFVLKAILIMLAPIIPFVTDYIYRKLYGKSVHNELWPEVREPDKNYLKLTKIITAVNSAIWKFKKNKGLSLKAKVKVLYLPLELKPFEKDLKAMHRAEIVKFGELAGEIIENEGVKIGIDLA